jgi:hypothetical protein
MAEFESLPRLSALLTLCSRLCTRVDTSAMVALKSTERS